MVEEAERRAKAACTNETADLSREGGRVFCVRPELRLGRAGGGVGVGVGEGA